MSYNLICVEEKWNDKSNNPSPIKLESFKTETPPPLIKWLAFPVMTLAEEF